MKIIIRDREFIGDLRVRQMTENAENHLIEIPDGWYGIPGPRSSSDNLPDLSGGYSPLTSLYAPRTLATKLVMRGHNSTLPRAAAEDWIGSLTGLFPIVYEDENGPRELLRNFQSAVPNYRRLTDNMIQVTLFTTAPDPVKYGAEFWMWVDSSTPSFRNVGDTPVFPMRFDIGYAKGDEFIQIPPGAGGVVRLQERDGTWHRLRWVNPTALYGSYVEWDLHTMTAKMWTTNDTDYVDVTAGIIEDDLILAAPGSTNYEIILDDGIFSYAGKLVVRPGWM